MTKFLIATHGYLADGFKSSLSVIMGEEITNKISTLNLFVDDEPITKDAKTLIDQFFKAVDEDEQVIVFSDILHGSVNQFIMPYIDDQRIFILTGVNLPLLCEMTSTFTYNDKKIDPQVLRSITANAQKETIYVNDYMSKSNIRENDDSTFFE